MKSTSISTRMAALAFAALAAALQLSAVGATAQHYALAGTAQSAATPVVQLEPVTITASRG